MNAFGDHCVANQTYPKFRGAGWSKPSVPGFRNEAARARDSRLAVVCSQTQLGRAPHTVYSFLPLFSLNGGLAEPRTADNTKHLVFQPN